MRNADCVLNVYLMCNMNTMSTFLSFGKKISKLFINYIYIDKVTNWYLEAQFCKDNWDNFKCIKTIYSSFINTNELLQKILMKKNIFKDFVTNMQMAEISYDKSNVHLASSLNITVSFCCFYSCKWKFN